MSLALLALGFIILLTAAYRLYGGWVARQFALDDSRATPAHQYEDGVDFVPTRPFYLFAQHFSAIAAAGPIAGPILACMSFGWLPCLLWISLGVVFIGAVHDFSSLAASVRHGATSIAEIAGEHLGRRAGLAMMAFIWIALVYVIVAFTDITAKSFVVGTEELQAGGITFHPGGAVAAASILYLGLSVVLGLVQKFSKPPLWLVTVVFVPAAFACAWIGTRISDVFVFDAQTWGILILAYCAIASVVPVWSLLQPRGYLGGFILYAALAIGIIGIFFGGYEVQQPAFKSWDIGGMTGTLFPFLFVTIACGACSGFHGLVCSGTTSKQVDRESHIQPVGYGAMLAEGFVALIALVTIMIVAPDATKGLAPGTIYGNGIGEFLTLLIGKENLPFAITFGAMAFSTFVFDTLDVCTRLARHLWTEFTGWKTRTGGLVGTIVTLLVPAWLVAQTTTDAKGAAVPAYRVIWPLFGSTNQLLAGLTLVGLSLWLARTRQPLGLRFVVGVPMVFMMGITIHALVLQIAGATNTTLVTVAAVLLALAVWITVEAAIALLRREPRTS